MRRVKEGGKINMKVKRKKSQVSVRAAGKQVYHRRASKRAERVSQKYLRWESLGSIYIVNSLHFL